MGQLRHRQHFLRGSIAAVTQNMPDFIHGEAPRGSINHFNIGS
jgi:hypothetical protein